MVEAFGKGEVELEAIPAEGGRRDGVCTVRDKPYNLATIARFLGWVKPSDGQAIAAAQDDAGEAIAGGRRRTGRRRG